ncbi:MAG TPA: DUF4832 domain-containing protein [Verrucomicrobiae bacterium]|nr:DUF4832 domain-containing protein [Verrucomicrobiae bacterium]
MNASHSLSRLCRRLAVCACIHALAAHAGTFKHITIDGAFDDWAGVPLAHSQMLSVTNAVDYETIHLANDDDYLYLKFTIREPANPFTPLQNLFVDADQNPATGFSANGLVGSELLVQAGGGYQQKNGGFNEGAIHGLNWAAAPGEPGTEFEARISRHASYASGGAPVFTHPAIAIVLESETAGFVSAEWAPSTAGGLAYTFAAVTNVTFAEGFTTNTYSASNEDIANPERGFYIQAENHASSPSSVPSNLASYRINGRNSPGNTYNAKITLLLRLFYLDTFVNAPISSNYLALIQADFNSIRAQGVKAIVRFAYNQDQTRPFNEPSKARILEHIAQLAPVLKKNSDVIAVVQQGFIAAWGEGYFTDVFYTNGQATAQNWRDRSEVLGALLAAVPVERAVQARTPQMKQKFVHGPTAITGAAGLTALQAFSGSDASRIGFHNDCFLADSTDAGTFADYDVGSGTSGQDVINLRNYTAQDSRYTPVGGETCMLNPPTDDCESAGGNADPDMALFHYSYLHQGYNANVNNKWVQHGCIDDIKRRLGYRIELISGIFRNEAQPGQVMPLTLTLRNIGFAAPYNPRGLELILRNAQGDQKYFAALSRNADPRRWLPGSNHVIHAELALPSDIPTGEYELLLNLPDPAPSLYDSVPYAIRLANSNALSSAGAVLGSVWEPATGYHRLHHTIIINHSATNAAPAGSEVPVLEFSSIAETYERWNARHFPSNPVNGLPEADPDLDGRVNLLEYAVGLNPTVAENTAYLNFSYTNATLILSVFKGPGVKDVQYEVQSSPVLQPPAWSADAVTVLENAPTSLRASYTSPEATGFLRLKLTLQ